MPYRNVCESLRHSAQEPMKSLESGYSNFDAQGSPFSTNFLDYGSGGGKILNNFNFKKIRTVIGFMMAYTFVYLACQILQISSLIKHSSHNSITVNSYAYNLLFTWLIVYFLYNFPDLISTKKPNIFLYTFAATIGGIVFALLGEIPALQFAIVKGWLKHLTPFALILLSSVTIALIILGYREWLFQRANGRSCISIAKFTIVALAYYTLFLILTVSGAQNIHYHVHHAIFCGALSLWFIDWGSKLEMCTHAVLMGIVVEGIDFYGIQELFLFLTSDAPVSVDASGIIAAGFVLIFFLYECMFYK